MLALLVPVVVLATAVPADAWTPKWSLNDDVWIQFGLLTQLMYEARQADAGRVDADTMERDGWSNEIFVRRVRMLTQGAFGKRLPFYVSSDSPNLGKHGNENEVFLNDAILEVNIVPQARIFAGRVLAPFSFENLQGAGTLLGVDYNVNALKIPRYLEAAYRDDGAELTGVLLGNWIEYRAGMFAGSRHEGNAHDRPRLTGRVMLNVADPQLGWFYFENGLGKKATSSIGAGFDYQENGGPEAGLDYQAWVVDGVVDRPLAGSGQVISFAAAYYGWRHGDGNFTGNTASVQGGWLLWGRVQPVLRWEHQRPVHGRILDTYHVGLNVYLYGYNANIKAEFAFGDRRDPAGHSEDAARVQVQIYL